MKDAKKPNLRMGMKLCLPNGLFAYEGEVDEFLNKHARDADHWLQVLEKCAPPEEVEELVRLGKAWQPYGGRVFGKFVCLAIAALNREDKSVEHVLENICHSGTLHGFLLEPKVSHPLALAS